MSEDRLVRESGGDRWRALPPRIALEDVVAGQEVPPKPQVIADPGSTEVDEATRYPI
ncbi:hypothetical protein [Actinomadura livida]|uniref:Uncharacterized protein n=1 Tax=Actinomadura livida TaxID=79909 RepID=A0A7W7I8P8_9ACTN|nr:MULTISPECIES: hypothetical protein [Actinomadura]MBB4772471.1 hypothetical protein [Actinomadura catellatispora]GGU22719.1 hypothetical protein GCM10010208_54600 [Actinomadura livida]